MKLKETIKYHAGVDIIEKHYQREQRWLAQGRDFEGPYLPLEGSFTAAIKTYADRWVFWVEMPLVVISRLPGIDAVVKLVRRNLQK